MQFKNEKVFFHFCPSQHDAATTVYKSVERWFAVLAFYFHTQVRNWSLVQTIFFFFAVFLNGKTASGVSLGFLSSCFVCFYLGPD